MNLAHSVLASFSLSCWPQVTYATAFKGMLFVEGVNQVVGKERAWAEHRHRRQEGSGGTGHLAANPPQPCAFLSGRLAVLPLCRNRLQQGTPSRANGAWGCQMLTPTLPGALVANPAPPALPQDVGQGVVITRTLCQGLY